VIFMMLTHSARRSLEHSRKHLDLADQALVDLESSTATLQERLAAARRLKDHMSVIKGDMDSALFMLEDENEVNAEKRSATASSSESTRGAGEKMPRSKSSSRTTDR